MSPSKKNAATANSRSPPVEAAPGIFADVDPDLRAAFRQRLAKDRTLLARLTRELRSENTRAPEAHVEMLHLAHQLYGTAAAFGMKRLSAAAGALQTVLRNLEPVPPHAKPLTEDLQRATRAMVRALDQQIKRDPPE